MDFDPAVLLLSLIPSGIGFVLFKYGRKSDRWPHLVTGIAFMAYPYFTGSVISMVTVGVALGAALYAMIQLGW
jgi:hypothetical protein